VDDYVAYETKTLARYSADQFLLLAAVTDRFARRVDAAGHRRVRHDTAAPYCSDQILPADDTVAIQQQVDQEIEYLRFDGNRIGASAQFAPLAIKDMLGK
jgi:hypothetical protein